MKGNILTKLFVLIIVVTAVIIALNSIHNQSLSTFERPKKIENLNGVRVF